jgi:hypothetical protein
MLLTAPSDSGLGGCFSFACGALRLTTGLFFIQIFKNLIGIFPSNRIFDEKREG